MSDPELKRLDHAIGLGFEMTRFLDSPVGRHIVTRCERLREVALEQLTELDPEDPKAIRAAQNAVRIVDTLQQWFADAVIEAEQAQERLQQMEQED